jgi:flagellar motor switch protein FliM
MSATLDDDSIAALFDAAREGRLDEAQAAAGRKRRVRAVDFNRPKKFSPEQERLLRRTVEDFARAASSRLSAEVRVPLELEVLSASQLVWADAHARTNGDAISVPIVVRPADRPVLLCIDLELMLRTIDLLTGGDDDGRTKVRRLTDIDLVLGELLVSRLVAQLEPVWADVLGFELEAGSLQAHLDTAQLAQVSEPTCAIVMEARLGTASATITLLVPWSVFAPAAARMEAGGDSEEAVDPRVAGAIGGAQVVLRGEVGRTRLSISDVLGLQPGDVLALDGRVADGVALTVDGVPVHRARPGVRNGRLAVQLS